MVFGLDGMDPETVDLLMSEGSMPNFARMRQNGAYGRLLSSMPMLSPVLWTTIATGKPPDQHGIGHFVAAAGPDGGRLPVTSEMRRVESIWNILSALDQRVAVVGWWATWPAETVNGAIVSDHTCYHFLFAEGEDGAADPTGVTYPPQLFEEIAPLVRRPDAVTLEDAANYIDVGQGEFDAPFDFSNDVSHFKWALATADSYRDIGLRLWRQERPDLLMVYIEGMDSLSHMFGHLFRAGELSGELAEQQAKFGTTVEEMYLYADRLVGEYIDAMDDDTTLVALSDHGFDLGTAHGDRQRLAGRSTDLGALA
jgi:predicted AlkP superfamily phosphohydrolase/phosphomutase